MASTSQSRVRCTQCSREYQSASLARCGFCLGLLYELPVGWHGHAITNKPRRPTVLRAQDLRAKRFRRRRAGALMARICGVDEIPAELALVLTGAPSSGKSTMLISLLEDGTWKNPLLCAAEEGLGLSLADRLTRVEAVATSVCDATSFPELVTVLEDHGRDSFDVLALDSLTVSGMRIEELLALRRTYGVSVIAVVQVLKSGVFAGSNAIKHDVDLFVSLTELNHYRVEKSWFSPVPRAGVIREEEDDYGEA